MKNPNDVVKTLHILILLYNTLVPRISLLQYHNNPLPKVPNQNFNLLNGIIAKKIHIIPFTKFLGILIHYNVGTFHSDILLSNTQIQNQNLLKPSMNKNPIIY